MGEHRDKETLWLSLLGLVLVAALIGAVYFQVDNFYLLNIKGDPNTRVLTADIRVGPLPILFWGAMLLYLWAAARLTRIPLRTLLPTGIGLGIILHQALLLLQLEWQYPAFGAYTSGTYYGYMRAVFFVLLFSLGAYTAMAAWRIRHGKMDNRAMILALPSCFLFLGLLFFSLPKIPWLLAGVCGAGVGTYMEHSRLFSRIALHLRRWPIQRIILAALFLLAFIAVLGFSFRLIGMHCEKFPTAGDDDWHQTAAYIAEDMLHPAMHGLDIALGYILFLAMIYKVIGMNFYFVGVVQALLAACSVLLIYGIGRRLFSRNVGIIAAALLALNGPLLNLFSTLSTEGVYAFLILLMFCALLRYRTQEGKTPWYLALAAFAFVGAELTKPQTFLFIIPILLWLWVTARKRQWQAPLAFVVAVVLIMTPLALYNISLIGKFDILTAGGARAYSNIMGRELNRIGVNPYVGNPVEYVDELIEKRREVVDTVLFYMPRFFIRFFFSDWFGNFDLLLIHRNSTFAYQLRFYAYLAILFGCWLVWRARKEVATRWRDQLFIFSFIPYTTAIILLVSSSKVRYRIPLDPLFMLLIAVVIVWLWEQTKRHTAARPYTTMSAIPQRRPRKGSHKV